MSTYGSGQGGPRRRETGNGMWMRCLSVILCLSCLVLPAQAERRDAVIMHFGIYTAEKPTGMVKKFRPFINALERSISGSLRTNVQIQFKVAATYEEGIDDIVQGRVDFSRFGPVSFIEALDKNPKVSILSVESKDGSVLSHGIICVREDSPIKDVADLQGKSFAFGSELSTIGRYLSQQHLLNHGVTAASLSRYEYLDRHDAVGAAVGNGRFDAGALKEETFHKLRKNGTQLRELARFENAPQTWVAREGLPSELEQALRQALLDFEDKKLLASIDADRLVEGKMEYYELVRTAIAENGRFFQ